MPSVLHTRRFKEEFLRCVGRKPVQMTFAVPYIGRLPWARSIVDFFRHGITVGSTIRLVTSPPDGRGGSLDPTVATIISDLGVDLLVRGNLHAKVYQFTFREGDRSAFVGSANLSNGGFERNDETVAYFSAKEDNDAVERELERLSGNGSFSLLEWHIRTNRGVM